MGLSLAHSLGYTAGEAEALPDLLPFPWVAFMIGRVVGGQSPPRVSSAMAISASGLW